ncbi:MAG: hypothetical protein KIH65_002250 [Candidatus Uhrbacteria bacterium]|nr:hypothetical protein [Candidatus Uhrbacteria bacterium]
MSRSKRKQQGQSTPKNTVDAGLQQKEAGFIIKKIEVAPLSSDNIEEKKPQVMEEKGSGKLKNQKDDIQRSLTAIYEGQPSKEWLNTLDRGRQKTWVIVLSVFASLVFFVGVAAWVGFWWFGNAGFAGRGIEIQIEGPDRITIGQEVSYFINWYNVAREPLASTEFRINVPSDFVMTSVDPSPTNEPLVFRLGAQPIEGRGTMKISGIFTGAMGTKSSVQVIAMYRPASFNSDFEQLSTKEIAYGESVLQGAFDLPSKVVPGDIVTLKYRVTNTASRTIDGLRTRIELPAGFVLSGDSQMRADDQRMVTVPLPPIESGTSTSIEMKGSFAVKSGGDLSMMAETGFVLANDTFAPAVKTEGVVSVLAGDLDIDLVINGSQDDRNVNVGEWQRIALSYTNVSGEPLQDVELSLLFHSQSSSSVPFDWSKIEDTSEGIRKGDVIRYTKKEIEGLAELKPNADGFIEVSIPLIPSVSTSTDAPIEVAIEAKIGSVGGDKVNRTVTTRPIVLRIQSDAKLASIARYTSEEGAPIGSGPLPPVVGSSTTYRVEWKVQKTLHSLDRLTMTATLPGAVLWSGKRDLDAGELSYDEAKKLVTWTVNTMPEDVSELVASFDVTLRPSEADVGRFAQVLGESRFEFRDEKLGVSVLRTAPALTTDLQDDALAQRKGVVKRP